MFERFTDKARVVVIAAKTKAQEHGDDQVRPAHILYGLAASDGLATQALTALGVDAPAVDRELARAGTPGDARGGMAQADEADDDAEALAAIGIDLDEIRRRIEESFGPGALRRVPLTPKGPLYWAGNRLPFNEQARLTLALSFREARAMHHNYIGTEHMLLGVIRVAERYPHGEFAAVMLPGLGLDLATAYDRALTEVLQLIRTHLSGR